MPLINAFLYSLQQLGSSVNIQRTALFKKKVLNYKFIMKQNEQFQPNGRIWHLNIYIF